MNLRPGGAWAMNALPTALIYSGSIFLNASSKPKGAACTAPFVG
jgi:hypothetical protein